MGLRALVQNFSSRRTSREEKLFRLVALLWQVQKELKLASTKKPLEGLEHFSDVLHPWEENAQVAELVGIFRSSRYTEREEIVAALTELGKQAKLGTKGAAVVRVLNRNTVVEEKGNLALQIKNLIDRLSMSFGAAVDTLHRLAEKVAQEM